MSTNRLNHHGGGDEKGLLSHHPKSNLRFTQPLSSSMTNISWSGSTQYLGSRSNLKPSKPSKLAVESGLSFVGSGGIPAPEGRVTLPLVVTAIVTIFGSSFPHGWNTGVTNAPAAHIKEFLNETYTERTGNVPSELTLNVLWSSSVALYLFGGCGGAFSAGPFANKFGRKRALLFCHVFNFAAAFLFAFCKMSNSFEMLFAARLVVGFGCGAGSGLVPMYLVEIAPVNIRGAMGVLHQFALTCGIAVSQCIGLRQVLGSEDLWPYLLALTAAPALVSCAVLPFFPESPRYLLLNKNDKEGAIKALQRFRGEEDVSLDIDEMLIEQEQHTQEEDWTFKQLLRTKELRLPLILVCSLACAQQLSGINVVFYYSSDVFAAAGIPWDKVQYAVLGTGIINVIMTGISVPLMEKAGRRPLLLGGMVLMTISAITITVALLLEDTVHWMSYVSIVCIIVTVIGFSIGIGSIPQFIPAELFKTGPRPPAMSIAGFFNWLCNFIIAIAFPPFEMVVQNYSFIPFIIILVGFGAFFFRKLPETKNKSYSEIYEEMGLTELAKEAHKEEEMMMADDDDDQNGGPVTFGLKNESEATLKNGMNGDAHETSFMLGDGQNPRI